MIFKIYHIPGVKIGCSTNPEDRVKRFGYTDFEILEEHEDIYIASDREIQLQEQYGYGRDNTLPYYKTVRMASLGGLAQGHILGSKNVESGHWQNVKSKGWKSKEHQLKTSTLGGLANKGIPKPHAKETMLKLANIESTCPHCNKTVKGGNYYRWHGENCKNK